MNSKSETIITMPTTPVIGFVIAAVHVIFGTMLNVKLEASIPTIYMQLLQAGAWVMAIIAGGFTAYGVWRTHHGRSKRKKTS